MPRARVRASILHAAREVRNEGIDESAQVSQDLGSDGSERGSSCADGGLRPGSRCGHAQSRCGTDGLARGTGHQYGGPPHGCTYQRAYGGAASNSGPDCSSDRGPNGCPYVAAPAAPLGCLHLLHAARERLYRGGRGTADPQRRPGPGRSGGGRSAFYRQPVERRIWDLLLDTITQDPG